jgi:hypothetical protein
MKIFCLKLLIICIGVNLFSGYKVHAQNLSLSVQSSSINVNYNTETDFETTRFISKAITYNIIARKGVFVYARLSAQSNLPLINIPQNPFSLKVNTSSVSIASSFYQSMPLSYSDVLVFQFNSKANKGIRVENDLIINPIGYNFEPGNFLYSIIFTVTEQ